MKIGDQIALSHSEQAICKLIAKMRFQCARSNGVRNAKIGGLSNEMMDLGGFAGELAFAKEFNVCPDLSIYVRSAHKGEDAGGDATLPNGMVIDVKATERPDGRLLVQRWKPGSSIAAFALMTGPFPIYTFRGFIPTVEMIKDDRLRDLGHGPGYVADQYELLELEELESGMLLKINVKEGCDLGGLF